MKSGVRSRDYSLLGADAQEAEQNGLVAAEWYRCDLPRRELKELMKRSDTEALCDTAIWLGAMVVFGGLGAWFWETWLVVPCFLCYGVLYGSASASRWHECGHGTAFKTRWLNDVVYQIASFMVMREPTVRRWSHARHHTDTLIVGRDPEIVATRPPQVAKLLANVFGIVDAAVAFGHMVRHAAGRLNKEEMTFVPAHEWHKIYLTARTWLAIYGGVILACFATASVLPAMFIGLPFIYGAWLGIIFGLTQHAGLAEDVLDHRLNSRTVHMNPVFRFIYWNMNYHVEHHMFPMVPYHALPKLHAEIKNDCPPPHPSVWAACCEIIPALLRQTKDSAYFVRREPPVHAGPDPRQPFSSVVAAK